MHLAEEGGEALEVLPLPRLERVVVALGAVEPDAEERPRGPRGQPLGVGPLHGGVEGHAHEVDLGPVGPDPLAGDQVAHEGVVRPVPHQLVAQPGDEPMPAVEQERTSLGADKDPGQPLAEIIGEPPVAQERLELGTDPSPLGPGLEPADLLQRRDRPRQSQRQPAEDR